MVVVPSTIRRDIGQLLIGSLPGKAITPEMRSLAREFSLGGVIFFARNIEAPEQVAESVQHRPWHPGFRCGSASIRRAASGAAQSAVHRVAADGHAWPQRRRDTPPNGSPRHWPPNCAPWASRSTTRPCSTSTPTRRIRSSATARWPKMPRTAWRGWARRLSRACRATGSRPAATLPGTRRHVGGFDLLLVEHPPDRIRRVEFVPFRAAVTANVAFIMTAHVLVPSLDEEKPATLSQRIVQGMLREELGFPGVILSDDLEMKAIAKSYTVPDAAVQAIAAGCDALLVCSGDVDVQAAALEALVRAVEQDVVPYKRLEDALEARPRGKGAVPGCSGGHQSAGHASSASSAATNTSVSLTRCPGLLDGPSSR